jgi:hypothetical protein
MQFLSMFLSDYLKEDQDKQLSKDLKYFQDKSNIYRRLMRLFNFITVAAEINAIGRSSKISHLKLTLLLSKASLLVYFVLDSILTVKFIQNNQVNRDMDKPKGIMRFWRYGYIFRLVSVISSAIFYTRYLQKSYQNEIALKSSMLKEFTPQEVLKVLESLTQERRIIYMKIFKIIAEFFIVVHFTGIAQKVFFIKFERFLIGIIGFFSATLEMYIVQASKRCPTSNEILRLC